ncbi:TIGR02680 family protein [Brevibacillus sp. NPDC058079]|uniref:TIGR02680 family protein n=1 Tax=Brevibacillus sp. NPDC058079 TaxID=3346330 RepID=UPI0036E4EBAA
MAMVNNTLTDKWIPSRAGFINYWFYEEEIYDFEKGNILFGGNNGHGKSVTMQHLLPLLLDGKKDPWRLDPFGSKHKRIKDYMFLDGEEFDTTKIAYIFMEYKKRFSDEYITTGIGIRFKNESEMESWGYVVKNKRVNIDFRLVKEAGKDYDGKDTFLVLNKEELKAVIKELNGSFSENPKQYAEDVNKHMFKFKDISLFNDLTDLIIQVRKPKLGNDFKPSILSNLLSESLSEVPHKDLSNTASTMRDIDERQKKISKHQKDLKLIEGLANAYNVFQEVALREVTKKYSLAREDQTKLELKVQDKHKVLKRNQEELQKVKSTINKKKELLNLSKTELSMLSSHEVRSLSTEKNENIRLRQDSITKLSSKQKRLEEKKEQEIRIRDKVKYLKDSIYINKKESYEDLEELKYTAEEVEFKEGVTFETAVHAVLNDEKRDTDFFKSWNIRIDSHIILIRDIINVISDEEHYRKELNTVNKEFEEIHNLIGEMEDEVKKLEEALNQSKETYQVLFGEWLNENDEYVLNETDIGEMVGDIDDFYKYTESTPQRFEEKLKNTLHELKSEMLQEKSELKFRWNNLGDEQKALKKELSEWGNKREPEPERRKETEEVRKQLTRAQVPFVPFYEAVDFKGNLSDFEKERIESALIEMGILDSLIVPHDYLGHVQHNDSVIVPKELPMQLQNLTEVFDVVLPNDTKITTKEVEDVLKSISLEEHGNFSFVTKSGYYQHGIVIGHAVQNEYAKYIGKESRKRFKEAKIAELIAVLKGNEEELESLTIEMEELEARKSVLVEEYSNRPSLSEIINNKKEIDEKNTHIKIKREDRNKLDKKRENINIQYRRRKNERIQLTKDFSCKPDLDTFKKFQITSDGYKNEVMMFKSKLEATLYMQNNLGSEKDREEDIAHEIQEAIDEISDTEKEIRKYEHHIKVIDDLLRDLDAESIEIQILDLENKIETLEEEIDNLKAKPELIEASITDTSSEINYIEEELVFSNQFLRTREAIFKAHLRLSGRNTEDHLDVLDEILGSGEVFYQGDPEKKEKLHTVNSAKTLLVNEYSKANASGLEDYILKQIDRNLNVNVDYLDAYNGKYLDKITLLEDDLSRSDIEVISNGEKRNPLEFKEYLEKEVESKQKILRRDEEDMLKRLVIDDLGKEIKNLISKAKQWEKDINEIMSLKDEVKLRISWQPKEKSASDGKDTLSTRRLVSLLDRDVDTLKDEDFDALVRHFSVKIEEAKTQLNKGDDNRTRTLEEALRYTVDYRKWYYFKIYITLKGESEVVLDTDKFSKLSGGQRAMAIYIPLFSAVCSKYKQASLEAPQIIALDEAFAGVDEENIEEMFALMEEMGFNYILTSQALWGDYPSVPGIAIYQLDLDKTTKQLTPMPYVWNGKQIFENEKILKHRHGLTDESFLSPDEKEEIEMRKEWEKLLR